MRLLHKTIGLFIAILGVMVIESSETEDRKYRIVEDVNHRNEDNISISINISTTSTTSTTNDGSTSISPEYRCNRCVGKVEIEVTPHPSELLQNAIIKMDRVELNMFSNRKWTNITATTKNISEAVKIASTTANVPTVRYTEEIITQKHKFLLSSAENQNSQTLNPSEVEQDNKYRVKRSDGSFLEFSRPENLTQAIPDTKSQVDESVEEATDTLISGSLLDAETIRDVDDQLKDPSKKLTTRNQLDDSDGPNLRKATSTLTSTRTIKVLSAKQILSGTLHSGNSDHSTHSRTNRLAESTLEAPLILEPQVLGASMWVSKNASQGDDHDNPYLKKDHSKPSINLVDGKPNKVFYEIKPSLNTAMDEDDAPRTWAPVFTTTKRSFLAGFKIPSIPSSFGKYGPYFLDNDDGRNVTERIGSTVLLDCRIGLLGDKKVTWLQHDKDSIRLLTVGNVQYSADERISLKFQYPDNWRLQITYATLRDNGLYKCQVEIDPSHSLVKRYNVIITG
ncbi:hypothetical protein KQX54_020268 [Cotesia glomerata]|uniref:Ig-like domain-containing protein n=1 Tax=Cotesia glomerata TaxID=32391 RepID=A0AAV7I263_COTGL|nr:hypothetical protein KQX54_020268 [Cotesia glomerata]